MVILIEHLSRLKTETAVIYIMERVFVFVFVVAVSWLFVYLELILLLLLLIKWILA